MSPTFSVSLCPSKFCKNENYARGKFFFHMLRASCSKRRVILTKIDKKKKERNVPTDVGNKLNWFSKVKEKKKKFHKLLSHSDSNPIDTLVLFKPHIYTHHQP